MDHASGETTAASYAYRYVRLIVPTQFPVAAHPADARFSICRYYGAWARPHNTFSSEQDLTLGSEDAALPIASTRAYEWSMTSYGSHLEQPLESFEGFNGSGLPFTGSPGASGVTRSDHAEPLYHYNLFTLVLPRNSPHFMASVEKQVKTCHDIYLHEIRNLVEYQAICGSVDCIFDVPSLASCVYALEIIDQPEAKVKFRGVVKTHGMRSTPTVSPEQMSEDAMGGIVDWIEGYGSPWFPAHHPRTQERFLQNLDFGGVIVNMSTFVEQTCRSLLNLLEFREYVDGGHGVHEDKLLFREKNTFPKQVPDLIKKCLKSIGATPADRAELESKLLQKVVYPRNAIIHAGFRPVRMDALAAIDASVALIDFLVDLMAQLPTGYERRKVMFLAGIRPTRLVSNDQPDRGAGRRSDDRLDDEIFHAWIKIRAEADVVFRGRPKERGEGPLGFVDWSSGRTLSPAIYQKSDGSHELVGLDRNVPLVFRFSGVDDKFTLSASIAKVYEGEVARSIVGKLSIIENADVSAKSFAVIQPAFTYLDSQTFLQLCAPSA